MRWIAFALFAVAILSLSFAAAEEPQIVAIKEVSAVPFVEPTSIFKLYDFVREIDIKAYQCRLGPYPSEFPEYFDDEICNRQFLDITSDDRLDLPDEDAVGGTSWANYAMHHFFVLEDVDRYRLRAFVVGYVSYNNYHGGEEHHYFYVKNFDTNEWELLDDAYVERYEQGFMGYCSDFRDQSDYVNEDDEMWFMGTEGMYASNAIATDAFGALLIFSIFGVDEIDQGIYPDWMDYLFE